MQTATWGLVRLAAAGQLFASNGAAANAGESTKHGRPNIIRFLSDDHGYHDSGVQGDPFARTPNIDQLAAGSMRFARVYAGSPLCVPSRCVIQSGRMPFSNGAHAFGTPTGSAGKDLPGTNNHSPARTIITCDYQYILNLDSGTSFHFSISHSLIRIRLCI